MKSFVVLAFLMSFVWGAAGGIHIGDCTITEGDQNMTVMEFPVRLTFMPQKRMIIAYTVKEDTAKIGKDIVVPTTSLIIEENNYRGIIKIYAKNDRKFTQKEKRFFVELITPIEAIKKTATGIIVENDLAEPAESGKKDKK